MIIYYPDGNRLIPLSFLNGILCIFVSSCFSEPQPILAETIRDPYTPSEVFREANDLKYRQDYPGAAGAFRRRLGSTSLDMADSLYCMNSIAYCQLMINQTEGIEKWLDESSALSDKIDGNLPGLRADLYFNKGRYYLLKNEPEQARKYAYQALGLYYQTNPPGHLKTVQTLILLALTHLRDGNRTDSIHFYAIQTNDYFRNNPALKEYDWENNYVQAHSSLLKRAHEQGEHYCREVLEKLAAPPLKNNNPWLEARTLNLLGNMLKKQADWLRGEDERERQRLQQENYQAADALFRKAIAIGKNRKDAATIDFYLDWIINSCRMADSTHFLDALREFEQVFANKPDWKPYRDWLLGFYYYERGDPEKVLTYYHRFLEEAEQLDQVDYRIMDDSYYSLREKYKEQNDFRTAFSYAKKGYLLFDCCRPGTNILDEQTINLLDRSSAHCLTKYGFFANILIRRYQVNGDAGDLYLANKYYSFIEQHSFETLLNKDEDAFLTFQLEAGTGIFRSAFEASFEAWTLDRDPRWLDKALQYMEYMKSFLLYRDLLRNQTDHPFALSDPDSIRLLQGRVTALQYVPSTGPDDPDRKMIGSIPEKLLHLNMRRKEKIDRLGAAVLYQTLRLGEIQRSLSAKQGIVSYLNGYDKLYGIYIDRDSVLFFRSSYHRDTIAAMIKEYMWSMELDKNVTAPIIDKYRHSAGFLYQALIGPFAGRLTAVDQLVVVPDHLLDRLPFEAFLTEEPDPESLDFRNWPYFLQAKQITYSPSWRVFAANRTRIRRNFKTGNIGYWTTPELNENEWIQKVESSLRSNYPGKYQIRMEAAGEKDRFLQTHNQYEILNLLLHARSSKMNRNENWISFGRLTRDSLYGEELSGIAFRSKLLILASCESATGTVQAGEGTFSLTRSFINAGIPQIISAKSLIPQNSTGLLLSFFYGFLKEGHDAAAALQLAKLEYLRSGMIGKREAFPKFWAGLVVFGSA